MKMQNHQQHHKLMISDFKKRFFISVGLTMPILILSPMVQNALSYQLLFYGASYISLGLATIIFFYGGKPFLLGSVKELMNKNPGMMTLISVAIIVAYLYSTTIVFGLKGKMFFWELATLIDIMLLGHWLEMKSVVGASKALELLVKMLPNTAHLIKDTQVIDVKLGTLVPGNIILIKPGEKVPADSIVVAGKSYLDESMITGESRPVKKEMESLVVGGSINGNGALKVKVKHTGQNSYLSKVINLVSEAQKNKSKTQLLADHAARWLTFIALTSGFITLIVWLLLKYDLAFALERMVTVMVISCPHALGLAIPLVVTISISLSAKKGLLIKNRTAFENTRKITTLIFDKTGTLTKGHFGVSTYKSINTKYHDNDILKYAFSLEQNSEHPIAIGIVALAKKKQITPFEMQKFKVIPGQGIMGKVNNKNIKLVRPGYLHEHNINSKVLKLNNFNDTSFFVLAADEPIGFISLADEIRPESFEAIKTLRKKGIKTIMITGDNKKIARKVSEILKLNHYYAETLPHQKLEIIKKLQQAGEYVAMTGDGVNDAPALAQADIGIAVGSGTDIAAETADIILVNSNPKDIAALIFFGKTTYNKMVQNLMWATAYNAFAIPLAAGVLYKYNIILNPAVGAIFMSLSTIVVAFNAQFLKKSYREN